MVQLTLLEISSLVVRNEVVDGRISNLSHLPLALRRWLFKVFRMKQLLEHERVIRLFEQPGFFDEFVAIRMHDDDEQCRTNDPETTRVFDGSFVETLLTILITDRCLAGNITELSLGFSAVCSSAIRHEETRRVFENIAKLLAVCKNLKRLQLVSHMKFPPKAFDVSVKFPLSSEITDVSLPALEHLSLIGCTNYFSLKWLPRRWFESIQSLELQFVQRDLDTYVDVLTACRDTLTRLTLKCVCRKHLTQVVCPLPIALPKLKSFWFESRGSHPTIFEKILTRCPNLTTVMVKMRLEEIFDNQLAAIARLSTRLQLDLTMMRRPYNFHKLVEIAGECIVGLSFYQLTIEDYDRILARCRNLRSLELRRATDEADNAFLAELFSDRERAATLTHVGFMGNLSLSVLNCLFKNLTNLQHLLLEQTVPYPTVHVDISNCLRVWIENGARPVSISLCGIEIDQESFCLFVNTCGRSLRNFLMLSWYPYNKTNRTELNLVVNCCPFIEYFIKCHVMLSEPETTQWRSIFEHHCFNYEPFYAPVATLKNVYWIQFRWLRYQFEEDLLSDFASV